jgi:hypothetical protein
MKNSLINQIKTLLGMEVKLEQMKLMDGVTVLEADSFEAGNEVFIVTEDEQKIPLPIGEYEFEDGRMLIVVEEGLISEVKEKEMEEPETEVEVETEKKEEMETEKPTAKKTIESVVKETFFSEIEKLKEENETLRNLNLSGDLNVSAYLELPIGTHVVGNDTITVAEREVDGYDGNKFTQKYIVSIIPKDANTNLSKDEEVKPISFNPENENKVEAVKFATKRSRTIMDSVMNKINK